MKDRSDEIHFEEDQGFYLSKKAKRLALGALLLVAIPLALHFMFMYLLRASELFPREAAVTLAFMFGSLILGAYLTVWAVRTPRVRFHFDKMTNPGFFGRKYIPYKDIKRVVFHKFGEDVVRVEVVLKADSRAARGRSIGLGRFLSDDVALMSGVLKKKGVKRKLQ